MTTEIALVPANTLVALNTEDRRVKALLYNIQQGGGVTEADIRKVKNPSGGGIMLEIDRPGQEPEGVRELVGVPILVVERRQLWAEKGNIGSGDRPVCKSNDMINGVKRRDDKTGALDLPKSILDIAIPGGEESKCAGCYFDQWDTAVNAKGEPTGGKRCAETRVIYFLRTGDVLPVKVTVPPSSLGRWKQSIKTLPARLDECVVRLFLTKEEARSGEKVGVWNVEFKAALDDDAVEKLNAYRKLFSKVIENATAERTDADDAKRRQERARPGRKDEADIPADQKFK